MSKNALIIIAKYPESDNVKTRLKGVMSDNARLQLYIKLLYSTIERLSSIPGIDTFIAFAPAESDHYFLRFNLDLIPLHHRGLGEGMLEAFMHVYSSGYERATLVGADIPGLTPEIITDSFNKLTKNDLVFGPAEDGGYYLVGMNKLICEVFKDVTWSSNQTLSESLRQAEKYGYTYDLTHTLFDIDTIEDVKRAGLMP
ncbi:MAG: TIGR04282 family arsenosugar biosynthesis glycosyltransferase [Nitrospira sp.]|nr:TIGR04282 family arsenosugar biosynthesis glycosyltransferase [bacterium]MBL7049793.1 TIGR04282 family arsenosugar biosynthesis glycosyltransferase [Nitrospira sp.]